MSLLYHSMKSQFLLANIFLAGKCAVEAVMTVKMQPSGAAASGASLEPRDTGLGVGEHGVAGDDTATQESRAEYFWPHARGRVGHYSLASYVGPANMTSSLAWSWHHPAGRYRTILVGAPLLDSQKNIYLASEDGVRKFTPDGTQLWYTQGSADLSTCPSLMGGALYGSSVDGVAFALDMQTGRKLWESKLANATGVDTAYAEAHDGVVVLAAESGQKAGNMHVFALNASDGSTLWDYRPDLLVWNFMPVFYKNESMVFMDFQGGVYSMRLHSGELLWRTPPAEGSGPSSTDGGVLLSPDGLTAFACSDWHANGDEGTHGLLRALRYSDGTVLWSQILEHPCTTWPVITEDGSTVVVPTGSFPDLPPAMKFDVDFKTKVELEAYAVTLGDKEEQKFWHTPERHAAVQAFDTRTGNKIWGIELPPALRPSAAGDEEGVVERVFNGLRPYCLPAAWSAPTIAADGTVYVGRDVGKLMAIRAKGTGANAKVDVSSFDTGSAFLHPGVSFAPGLMAVASCDTLFVFNV